MSAERVETILAEHEFGSLLDTIGNYGCIHPVGSPVEADGTCSKCLSIALAVKAEVERILSARLVAAETDGLAEDAELRAASRNLLSDRVSLVTGRQNMTGHAQAWDRFALAIDAAEDAASRFAQPVPSEGSDR